MGEDVLSFSELVPNPFAERLCKKKYNQINKYKDLCSHKVAK